MKPDIAFLPAALYWRRDVRPIEMAVTTREGVCRGDRRKYYRLRPARFYGGIATADCVGCNLRCVYCWSRQVVTGPERTGEWHSPDQVARTLFGIARRKQYRRLSPHFSPGFCCGGGYRHVYCVALGRAPRRSVHYVSGALGRAPCIHARLHRLATNPGEKCGLGSAATSRRSGGNT